MKITCDPARTAERFAELEQYMVDHVLDGKQFRCSSFGECRSSSKGAFYQGQLHHLGRYYDLEYDDRAHRVVVVGQEYGAATRYVALAKRRRRIESSGRERRFKTSDGHPGRNPHMKGTTTALRLLHGHPAGEDYGGEFIEIENVGRKHLFETFSLANYLLCSAVKRGTKAGRSTTLMKRNCSEHFRRTLEILSPTVIVIQGKGFASWVTAAIPGYEEAGGGLGQGVLPEGPVTVVPLSHPSAHPPHRWSHLGSDYLETTVRPLLSGVWSDLVGER